MIAILSHRGLALIALGAMAFHANADPLILPKSADQAVDFGGWLMEIVAIVVIGKLLIFIAAALFVVLHIALSAMIVVGLIKKRYWRAGIRLCLISLAVLYSALFYAIHQSHQREVVSQKDGPQNVRPLTTVEGKREA